MKMLQVKVKPNARDSVLDAPVADNIWSARLQSPPVDGPRPYETLGFQHGLTFKVSATTALLMYNDWSI